MSRRATILALFLPLLLPPVVAAQTATATGVSCNTGHFRNITCNGTADCDAKWRIHIEQEHGGQASNPGTASATYPVFSLTGSPPKAFVGGIIFGAPLGALLGSLGTDANGKNQAATGAGAGFGAILLMGTIANSQWSRPAKAFVGALGGAAVGAAVGTHLDGQVVEGSPEALTTKKKVATYAAGGALIGATTGLIPPSELRWLRAVGSLFRTDRSVALTQAGNTVGARIQW